MNKVLKRLKSNGLVTSTKDYHAKLVIYGIPRMESKDIKRLGQWLGKLEEWALEVSKSKKGSEYAQVFTNKLMK